MQEIISSRIAPNYYKRDYFTASEYEKTDIALNDVDPLNIDQKFIKNHEWLKEIIVKNDLNNKFTLPLMTDQRVVRLLWRKKPQKEIVEVLALNRDGLNEIFDSGDVLKMLIGKKYSDFTMYDDTLYINDKKNYSPIGTYASRFYEYKMISDEDSIVNIAFSPKKNSKEILVGSIIAVKDSIWRIKEANFSMADTAKTSSIRNLHVVHKYSRIPQGYWILRRNDVMAELKKWSILGNVCFSKTQIYSHISTDSIEDKRFWHKAKLKYNSMASYREPEFWAEYDYDLAKKLRRYRQEDSLHCSITVADGSEIVRHHQSESQRRINELLDYITRKKWIKIVLAPVKALINNYIEIGNPPVFNVEPVTSLVSYNDVDKWRIRFGGLTTANLHKQLFLAGYVAYGFGSQNVYYQTRGTYSFNKKKYEPDEFPRRNINLESRYDICYLGERNSHTDHDNFFRSFHWSRDAQMMFYHTQSIELERDENTGIGYRFSMKREQDQATGGLVFYHLNDALKYYGITNPNMVQQLGSGTMDNGTINTMEFRLEFLFSPRNSRFYNSKNLVPVNSECPSIGVSHTIGTKILGGEYYYNITELKTTKQWFLGDLGIAQSMLKAGIIWNTTPFPLLLAPPANISYIGDEGSFSLINPFEFANDRYAQLILSWETNGNLIGLIPIIKKMRWKEYLAVKMLWGDLTDKNNPNLPHNMHSDVLMPFPANTYIMNPKKPYVEGIIGIHNIFNMINVEYIHRFTYTYASAPSGFRIAFHLNI